MPIVALRGYDGAGASDPSSPAPVVALPPSAPMPPLTALFWLASLSAVGYIFWATLQPKSRRLVT